MLKKELEKKYKELKAVNSNLELILKDVRQKYALALGSLANADDSYHIVFKDREYKIALLSAIKKHNALPWYKKLSVDFPTIEDIIL